MLNFSTDGKKLITGSQITSIYLYEVYYSDSEAPLRWAAWDIDVLWQGNTYTPAVIKHSDLEQNTDGQINDLSLTIGNVDRIIQYYIEQYDLIGKKVKIIQIFEGIDDFLPATFKIKACKAKKDYATFTLSMGFDFLLAEVPSRRAYARFCSWQFKGADGNCPYTGSDTICEHTFEACKAKGALTKIGCFPAIINERIYF